MKAVKVPQSKAEKNIHSQAVFTLPRAFIIGALIMYNHTMIPKE